MIDDTQPAVEERSIDDLTLAEVIGQLFLAPRTTFPALRTLLSTPRRQAAPMVRIVTATANDYSLFVLARMTLWFGAVIMGVIGCLNVAQPVTMPSGRLGLLAYADVMEGVLWWIPAILAAMTAEILAWVKGLKSLPSAIIGSSDDMPFRWFTFATAFPLMAVAYLAQGRNEFTTLGVLGWVSSLILLCMAFWPSSLDPRRAARRVLAQFTRAPRQKPWVMIGLLLVMLVAGYMRFANFETVPLEMTSDHIEKLMDAQRVADGARDIFFANNGGREPFQMYFVAFLGNFTGGLNFNTLKLAAVLESLAGVLVFYFLGRAIIGQDSRQADVLGLVFALMAAVGYWHLVVTRVSLRIMLTPLVTGLALWALIRLVRWNRRGDAIWAGVILGAGLYSYQALRLLPALAALAVLIGMVFVAQTWRQRAAYAVNLIVMAVISFAIFVPLLRFANDFPDDFWRRASGRLLGEDVICDYDVRGGCIPRSPTLGERLTALAKNVPAIGENMVRALGMFTYRGDIAWLHNAPNYPVFDPLGGAFLLTGLGAMMVWGIRRRDPVPLFLILALLVMLIPSASAIANTIENPSNTRASGAMPMAYGLAAFGLVSLIMAVGANLPRSWYAPIGVAMAALVALFAGSYAQSLLFGPYDDYYQTSWSPEREVGEFMRGFVESGGAWGNVYLLSYAHFFDYRGIGIQAGLKPNEFPNGDIPSELLLDYLRRNLNRRWDDPWVLDPDRDILIIYSANDQETGDRLKAWFPTGYALYYETRKATPWLPSEPFWAFRIPALGRDALQSIVTQ